VNSKLRVLNFLGASGFV